MPSAATIRLEIRRSRRERLTHAALLTLAIAGVLLAPASLMAKVVALIVCLAILGVEQIVSRRVGSIRWLEWQGDGTWRFATEHSAPAMARLVDAHRFGPWIRLVLQADRRKRSVVLWPDSADADELRRLRIRLRQLASSKANVLSVDSTG